MISVRLFSVELRVTARPDVPTPFSCSKEIFSLQVLYGSHELPADAERVARVKVRPGLVARHVDAAERSGLQADDDAVGVALVLEAGVFLSDVLRQ